MHKVVRQELLADVLGARGGTVREVVLHKIIRLSEPPELRTRVHGQEPLIVYHFIQSK